jgi:DNA-binding response OmpR family regulator
MDLNSNKGLYILVVDDDQDDQFFLRRAISEVIPQAIIESLYDGTEAVAYLDKCAALPHLIFLDLNMVKLSGKVTMGIIRKNANLNKVPVIILTTSKNEAEKDELLNMGANDFYTKPFEARDLLKIVTEVKSKWLA